jgi:hypothetical protein
LSNSFPRVMSPWKHKKTQNSYRVICVATGQCSTEKIGEYLGIEDELFVVYASASSGYWVRPLREFLQKFEEEK